MILLTCVETLAIMAETRVADLDPDIKVNIETKAFEAKMEAWRAVDAHSGGLEA
jgi:hypothetical protein